MRLVLSFLVLLALAANHACFAKEAHAQHGARVSAAKGATAKTATAKGPSGKGASASGYNGTPAEAKSSEPGATAPPVLPPRGAAQRANRNANLNLKIVPPRNQAHNVQTGATNKPTVRNAIAQPVVQSKNLAAAPLHPPPGLQAPGIVVPPIAHGAPAAPAAVSSSTARPNASAASVATLGNRGSSGAGVIRPAAAPSGVGGPARSHFGISGTTVQTRH